MDLTDPDIERSRDLRLSPTLAAGRRRLSVASSIAPSEYEASLHSLSNMDIPKMTTGKVAKTGFMSGSDFHLNRKSYIHQTLNDEQFSTTARVYHWFDMAMVVWSILIFLLQSELSLNNSTQRNLLFLYMDCAVSAYFTLDILLRFYTIPNKKEFFRDGYNVIDILALLSFYLLLLYEACAGIPLETMSSPQLANDETGSILRIFRMARVLRLVHLVKRNDSVKMITRAFITSFDGITMMLVIYFISIIFFSTMVYYAETSICIPDMHFVYDSYRNTTTVRYLLVYNGATDPSYNGKPCAVQSIVEAFWFVFVTICTVGYGDVVPRGVLGKFAASTTMVTGVLLLGLPTSIFGANFAEIYRKHRHHQELRQMRRLKVKAALEASRARKGKPTPVFHANLVTSSSTESRPDQSNDTRVSTGLNSNLPNSISDGDHGPLNTPIIHVYPEGQSSTVRSDKEASDQAVSRSPSMIITKTADPKRVYVSKQVIYNLHHMMYDYGRGLEELQEKAKLLETQRQQLQEVFASLLQQ